MEIRKPCLPAGWYPRNPDKISEFLLAFTPGKKPGLPTPSGLPNPAIAAVAPHAGWYYSGSLAAQAVAALAGAAPDTIAVIGGHLPQGMSALFAMEEAAETPLGNIEIDKELRESLYSSLAKHTGLKAAPDRYEDNTVEVLLPMVRHFFPRARLLWMRLPADIRSIEAGRLLAQTASSLERKLAVLGSNDLTHYGANYGFAPCGTGKEALDWVTKVNDRRFIDAVEAGDANAVLTHAEADRSSCSAGAVLGVMGYAAEKRGEPTGAGKLLAYGTSADGEETIPGSFVGYGAFVFDT